MKNLKNEREITGLLEPVPKLINCALKAHGFGTGSWKKRLEARFFPLNLRLLSQN
jgi:hypothetical protein